MKLRVVWIGKTKNPQLAKLCTDYISRIAHFLPLEITEIKEAHGGIRAEGAKILASLSPSDRVAVLDTRGASWTSDQLANFVQQHMTSDPRRLSFVIGGPDGLTDEVKRRADVQWSLSRLTFTQELTRVLVLEQLYRALAIIRNLPYSK